MRRNIGPKSLELHPAWIRVHFVARTLAALVKRTAARKDHVRTFDEPAIALGHPGWCKIERGKLVHAIVDERRCIKRIGKLEHHRGVQPNAGRSVTNERAGRCNRARVHERWAPAATAQ